jgi:sigma-B regulation protein RsbU (phosphoserine phosphatase)
MIQWTFYLPKFFLLAAILLCLLFFLRGSRAAFTPFLTLFFVFTLRDIAYVLVPLNFICTMGDVGAVLCYLFWLRKITGRKKLDWLALILGAIIVLGPVERALLGMLPSFIFFRSSWIYLLVLYLGVQMFQVTPFNTSSPGEVIQMRRGITYLFVLANIPLLIWGYQSWITHAIVYPLAYMAHLIVFFRVALNGIAAKELSISSLLGSREKVFDFMQKLSSAVSEKIEIEKILAIVANSAIENTNADGGAILMLDERQKALKYRAIAGTYEPPFDVPDMVKIRSSRLEDYLYSLSLEPGKTVLGESFQKADPVHVQRFAESRKDGQSPVSSLIVVPLLVAKRSLGVITVSKQAPGQYFSDEDFEHLKAFADYASLSIDMHLTYLEVLEKKQIERELGIAAEIQKKLLPAAMPRMKKTELAVHSLPVRGVSGDYYDLYRLDPEKLIVVVGDVAGKGFPAALVMAMVHSIFHLVASPKRDIATTLTWINRGLVGQVDVDRFATLCIVSFDEATRSLQYTNAGHLPLLVFRVESQTIEQVDMEGLPIGIDRASAYHMKNVSLDPGDIAVLYTDGITEALNQEGEQYGQKRLASVVSGNYSKKAEELKNLIQKDLSDFTGFAKQHDDQTLVILKTS